jgi:hypothetical protein
MKTFRLLLALLSLVVLSSSAFATAPSARAYIKAKHFDPVISGGGGGVLDPEEGPGPGSELGTAIVSHDVITAKIIVKYDIDHTYDGCSITVSGPSYVSTTPVTPGSGDSQGVIVGGRRVKTIIETGEAMYPHILGASTFVVNGTVHISSGSGTTWHLPATASRVCHLPSAFDDED